MENQGYMKTTSNHVYLHKFSNDNFIILLLYVDDMLIVDRNSSRIYRLNKQPSQYFDLKNFKLAKEILGT